MHAPTFLLRRREDRVPFDAAGFAKMAVEFWRDAIPSYYRFGLPGSAVGVAFACWFGVQTSQVGLPAIIGAYAALITPTATAFTMAVHLWRKNQVEIEGKVQENAASKERHEKEMREKDLELHRKEEERLAERDKRLRDRQAALLKQREDKAASDARIKEIEAQAQRNWQGGAAGQLVTEKLRMMEEKLEEALSQRDSYQEEVRYTRERNHDLSDKIGVLTNKLALAEKHEAIRIEEMAIQSQMIESLNNKIRQLEGRVSENTESIAGVKSDQSTPHARPGYTEE